MKLRNLLIGCSMLMAAIPSMAADYPEKLYLVGTMNNWTLPANGNLLEVPAVEEGLYSATMDFTADDWGTPVSFKIFNTLASSWENASEYYGAMMPNNNSTIFKGVPATWTLAPGYGSSDIIISNVTSLPDALITINLKENTITVSSNAAPEAPQEIYIEADGNKSPLQKDGDTSIYKGSVTLDKGPHKLLFTGTNGFLLGGTKGNYYIWNDREANYTMIANSEIPFTVYNWAGGKLEVAVNITNSLVSFTAPDQPAFPESINLVLKGENGENTKVAMPAVVSEYGDKSFNYILKDWQKDMQFYIEVPGLGTLLTDSEPIELWKNDTRYLNIDPEYKNFVTISNWEGGDLKLFIPEHFAYVSLSSDTQPLKKQTLYLIGSPQGWKIDEGTMELTQIDNAKFAGEFEMPESPQFRFYTELGDWESGSVGSQYNDAPVNVSLSSDQKLVEDMVYGKGTWKFNGLPAGKMYMEVDLLNMTATFSLSPLSGVDLLGNDDANIAVVAGGIEVSAPQGYVTVVYDLTGRIAGKGIGNCHISLMPGIYVVNKQKVMVK